MWWCSHEICLFEMFHAKAFSNNLMTDIPTLYFTWTCEIPIPEAWKRYPIRKEPPFAGSASSALSSTEPQIVFRWRGSTDLYNRRSNLCRGESLHPLPARRFLCIAAGVKSQEMSRPVKQAGERPGTRIFSPAHLISQWCFGATNAPAPFVHRQLCSCHQWWETAHRLPHPGIETLVNWNAFWATGICT